MKRPGDAMTVRPSLGMMPHLLGRPGREEIIREALRRVDGEPTPHVEPMQAAMSVESEIRFLHDVVRAYLDEHGYGSTRDWARATAQTVTGQRAARARGVRATSG